MSDPIKLECRGCGNAMDYDRAIDPDIPATVVRIVHNICDQCDDGDFGEEYWFDAEGNRVSPL